MSGARRPRLLQFGAGNIGRSFIGQLFARAGYEVVFADIDRKLVSALTDAGRYRVVVKANDQPDQIVEVSGIRAIDAADVDTVTDEIAGADLLATSVGQNALKPVIGLIARGIRARIEGPGGSGGSLTRRPLDIIIAENIRGGAELFRTELLARLQQEHPITPAEFDAAVGLVETSIGKMVPIMRAEDLAVDPLWVFAEPYNTLIVHRGGFRADIPEIPGMVAVENIRAYIDRKLFVHNLGHAACAYFGYLDEGRPTTIAGAIGIPEVFGKTRHAMMQSAEALASSYPEVFTLEALRDHVQDLLQRFGNRSLGDTIHRVGRDLYRKLGREDRLVGAMVLAEERSLPYDGIVDAYLAALDFASEGTDGKLFPSDARFRAEELPRGLPAILSGVSGLHADARAEQEVAVAIETAARRMKDHRPR